MAQVARLMPQADRSTASAEVANISSIVRQPNSEIVDVTYNQVVPQHIQGSLDDPAIRQLLMLASENASFSKVCATIPSGCWRRNAGRDTAARVRASATR